jgi:hypothetical protein
LLFFPQQDKFSRYIPLFINIKIYFPLQTYSSLQKPSNPNMHYSQALTIFLAILPLSVLSYQTELDDLDLFARDFDLGERDLELDLEARETGFETDQFGGIEIRNADPRFSIGQLLKSGKLAPAHAPSGMSRRGFQHSSHHHHHHQHQHPHHHRPGPAGMERRDQFADPELFIRSVNPPGPWSPEMAANGLRTLKNMGSGQLNNLVRTGNSLMSQCKGGKCKS